MLLSLLIEAFQGFLTRVGKKVVEEKRGSLGYRFRLVRSCFIEALRLSYFKLKTQCMDRREAISLPGSGSYYVQRGISGSGSGPQPELQGSIGIHPLSNTGMSYQSNIGGSSIGSTLQVEASSAISPHAHGINVSAPSAILPIEPVKRKRGRPRKYGPDGNVSLALSPSSTPQGVVTSTSNQKRGRGRPPGTGRKQQLAPFGEWLSGSAGMGFTPHILMIAVGEDVATKVMSFSQQGPRAVCVLSANGSVSTVTLRQPSTSGGTVTYEGRFEIVCLSGSYLLTETGGSRCRAGGLSVSLSGPDGRVIGGGVGGVLIAATPVQVIVGTFLYGSSKTKKKTLSGLESGTDSDHQTIENIISPTSVAPSQNLTPSSPMAGWPNSGTVNIRDAHVDIDLMRG